MNSNNKLCLIIVALCLCQGVFASSSDSDEALSVGRTFGHHFLKRISFAIIPAAFVVGVITTLLAALTVVSMKGLGVGVILLVLAVGQILARQFQAVAPVYSPPPVPFVYSHARAELPLPPPPQVLVDKAIW